MLSEDDPIVEVHELISLGIDEKTGENLGNVVNRHVVTARELIRGEWNIYYPQDKVD